MKRSIRQTEFGEELRCRQCREWLPANNEFFFNSSKEPTGLRQPCKACYSEFPSVIARKKPRRASTT